MTELRKLIRFSVMLLWLPTAAMAQAFQEGKDYQRLASPVPTAVPDKVEVLELFWYGCPHCYSLESAVTRWLSRKPQSVEFMRLPAVLGRRWELGARAYFTAETLGVLDKVHEPFFKAIHERKRTFSNKDQLASFFAEQGVDEKAFREAFDSFAVETKLRRSQELVRRYRIDGVPAVIVNGKYIITTSSAGSPDRMFEVVDFLVSQEEAAAG
jgi:thiol:disulfide interchange protein DsbA